MTAKNLFAVLALAALLLFSGCSTKKKPTQPPVPPATEASGSALRGTSWLLERLSGQAVQPGSTLNFDKDQASGSAGCNSYSGSYTEGVNGKFRFEAAVMTKNTCEPPEIMQQEQHFTEAMKAATAFYRAHDKLTLKNKAGVAVAVFKEQSQELKGTLWKVVRYSNGQGSLADVLSKGRPLTMTFGAGGQLTGSGGCNSYVANYTYVPSERSFRFEMIMMTTIQCGSDEIMEQEGNVMAALYAAAAYRIDNNGLTLQDADGNPVIMLRKN